MSRKPTTRKAQPVRPKSASPKGRKTAAKKKVAEPTEPRYKLFAEASGHRQRLLVAKYGPIAADWLPKPNRAFDYVLQVAANPVLLVDTDPHKRHLYDILLGSLKAGDGTVFRDIADAVEAIAAGSRGEVYNRAAYELLLSQAPPKDRDGHPMTFDPELTKTADEVLQAANKKPGESNRRTLRRLQELFGAELKRKNSVAGKKRTRR